MSRFCGECGSAVQRADQAFCAECGTPLGQRPTLPPSPSIPAPASAAVPAPMRGAEMLGPGPGPGQRQPTPRRHWGRVLGVVSVVIAVALAGVVVARLVMPAGGAGSPEDAVSGFVDAVVAQDALGALEMINPGEVDGADELYKAARERLAEEGLMSKDGAITEALSVTTSGMEYDVDQVADNAAHVSLTAGDVVVRFDPDKLPDRLDFIRDKYGSSKQWKFDLVEQMSRNWPVGADQRPYLTAIRVDGRWYVSAVATYGDRLVDEINAYDEHGVRDPDYAALDDDETFEPHVEKSPEDALSHLFEAAGNQDYEEVLASLPEDQSRALRPYLRPFGDYLANHGVDLSVALSGLNTDEDDQGDLVRLTINRADIDAMASDSDGDYESGSLSLQGRCVTTMDQNGYTSDDCLDQEVVRDTGIDSVFVMLSKTDGGWQVDPLATAAAYGTAMIEAVPSDVIDQAVAEICYQVNDYDRTGC